jgi:HEAT repeat protein
MSTQGAQVPQVPQAAQSPLPPLSARALPPRPSLEQLKKQAKELLAAVERGDLEARERLERYFPAAPTTVSGGVERVGAEEVGVETLSQAQLVVAREYGCASWAELRRVVEVAPLRALLEKAIERPIDWEARRGAMEELMAAGQAGLQMALDALSDPDPQIRGAALGFIDHYATDACVPQLTEVALHDPDPDVRRGALHALICERCKPEPLGVDVVPVLLTLMREDANRIVRRDAAGALVRLHREDDGPVQEAFRVAVRGDSSNVVRRAAVGGLRGEDLGPLLAEVAEQDPDMHVRVRAAERLGDGPYRELACRVLEEAIAESESGQVRREAHLALKRISPEYRRRAAQRARELSGATSTALR